MLGGWKIVDAVGLSWYLSGLLGRLAWLPLTTLLDQWDAVSSICISLANQYRLTSAGDEYVLLFVHCDPSLVKIDMFPSSTVLPTLNNDDKKSVIVFASAACLDNCGKGSKVTNLPLLVPPLATSMRFVYLRKIARLEIIWFCLLI